MLSIISDFVQKGDYLSAYGSEYSTKAKECDVTTVQMPLEDREMHLKCILYSVNPYLQRNTEREMGGSQLERQKKTFLVNVNKLIRKPAEIGIYNNCDI